MVTKSIIICFRASILFFLVIKFLVIIIIVDFVRRKKYIKINDSCLEPMIQQDGVYFVNISIHPAVQVVLIEHKKERHHKQCSDYHTDGCGQPMEGITRVPVNERGEEKTHGNGCQHQPCDEYYSSLDGRFLVVLLFHRFYSVRDGL